MLLRHVTVLLRYVTVLLRYVTVLLRYVTVLLRYVTVLRRHVRVLLRYVTVLLRYVIILSGRLFHSTPTFSLLPQRSRTVFSKEHNIYLELSQTTDNLVENSDKRSISISEFPTRHTYKFWLNGRSNAFEVWTNM